VPEETITIKLALESNLPLPLEQESFNIHLEPTQLIVLERC
jgi:hypothetical protein